MYFKRLPDFEVRDAKSQEIGGQSVAGLIRSEKAYNRTRGSESGSDFVRECAGVTGGEDGIRTHETLMRSTPLAGERLRPLGHLSGKGEIAGTLCHFKRIARQLAKFPANYRTLYIRDQKCAWNHRLSSGPALSFCGA